MLSIQISNSHFLNFLDPDFSFVQIRGVVPQYYHTCAVRKDGVYQWFSDEWQIFRNKLLSDFLLFTSSFPEQATQITWRHICIRHAAMIWNVDQANNTMHTPASLLAVNVSWLTTFCCLTICRVALPFPSGMLWKLMQAGNIYNEL